MMKKIFLLATEMNGFGVSGIALAEDGHIVGGHMSSNMGWLQEDLSDEWKHNKYDEHFGKGNRETVWCGWCENFSSIEGLQEAVDKLNNNQEAEKEREETGPQVEITLSS